MNVMVSKAIQARVEYSPAFATGCEEGPTTPQYRVQPLSLRVSARSSALRSSSQDGAADPPGGHKFYGMQSDDSYLIGGHARLGIN